MKKNNKNDFVNEQDYMFELFVRLAKAFPYERGISYSSKKISSFIHDLALEYGYNLESVL